MRGGKANSNELPQLNAKSITSNNDLNKIKVLKEKNNAKINNSTQDGNDNIQSMSSFIEIKDNSLLNKKQKRTRKKKKICEVKKGYLLRNRSKPLEEPENKIINCHQCYKIKSIEEMLTCINENCRESYCLNCHKRRLSHWTHKWICFKCKNCCICKKCKGDATQSTEIKFALVKGNKKKRYKRKRNALTIKRGKKNKEDKGNEFIHIMNNITVNNFCIIEMHNNNKDKEIKEQLNNNYLDIIKKCEERFNIPNEENFCVKCPLCQIDICCNNELLYFENFDDLKKYIEAIKLFKSEILAINKNSKDSQFIFEQPKVICKCCFMKVISFENYIKIFEHFLKRKNNTIGREKESVEEKELQQGDKSRNSQNVFNSLFNNFISNCNSNTNNNNANENKYNYMSNNNINYIKTSNENQREENERVVEQKEENENVGNIGDIYYLLINQQFVELFMKLHCTVDSFTSQFFNLYKAITDDIRNKTLTEEKKQEFHNYRIEKLFEVKKIEEYSNRLFLDFEQNIRNFYIFIFNSQRNNPILIQTIRDEYRNFEQYSRTFLESLRTILFFIITSTF